MKLTKSLIGILFLFTHSVFAQQDAQKQELMNVDAQFSKLSEARGVNEAFISYLAEDGVLLRPNNFPILGKEIIKERIAHGEKTYLQQCIYRNKVERFFKNFQKI